MLWTVLNVILKLILGVIALGVVIFVLLLGGCLALGTISNVSSSIQDAQDKAALEQARHAPLPPHVQRLTEDEFMYASSDIFWPTRDSNGRYMLTSEGLFDFAAGKLTKLDCPGLAATSGPLINFRNLWLDEQFFLWGRCVYDVTTLQPGPIEDVHCGDPNTGCGGNDFTTAIAPLARQADRVYQNVNSRRLEFLFVKLPSGGTPAQVWSVYSPVDRIAQNGELGHTPLKVPQQKKPGGGLRAHNISPNSEYDASLDLTALTIRRVTNGMLVAQVNFKNSTAGPALFGRGDDILGWTSDSRQVVFMVEEDFGRYGSLYQIFALTIP